MRSSARRGATDEEADMLTIHLGLVSEVPGHDPSDVARVAAALQRQIVRDFGPIWGVRAAVGR